jgi:spore coat polysaccharide biosynthesis protein SpsF
MKTIAFVQARIGSSRLPGKSVADIAGKPALQRIVERVGRTPGLDGVAVLTGDSERDDPIRALCARLDIPCVSGSEEDVLARFVRGLDELRPDRIVRVTADCPLVDPGVIGRLLELHDADHAAVATGAMAARSGLRRYPDGLDAEAVRASALRTAADEATDPFEREHVTPFLWRRPERFSLALLQAPEDWGDERWTVDRPGDLAFVRAVFERLDDPGIDDVHALLAREPQLRALNADERDQATPIR